MSVETKFGELGVKPNAPPSEESLLDLERDRIGAPLPDEYRRFLKAYNGCVFNDVVYYNSIESLYPNVSSTCGIINSLYGLFGTRKGQDILRALDCFSNDMAKGCVPIGANLFGDQICIGTLGTHKGKVCFWDHDVDLDDGGTPTIEKLPVIANSFNEFIMSLYTKPEDSK